MPGPATSYTCTLAPEQIVRLRTLLAARGWEFPSPPPPYSHWKAVKEKCNIVAYGSGKTTVQGKGTAEAVQFIIEPEILGEARFGNEAAYLEEERPEMFEPHAGIDESGKGDYFGPLVVACCYTDRASAAALLEAGVTDSKKIKDDRKIAGLAARVREITGGRTSLVCVGPQAYNRMYRQFGNLNRLLAWGHARALENLLEKVPECPRAVSDQFAQPGLVERALQERGRRIRLEQYPRAEADIAVAAASILARAEFVRRLEELEAGAGQELPKGAGPQVDAAARKLVSRLGAAALETVAKLHFKTTERVSDGLGC